MIRCDQSMWEKWRLRLGLIRQGTALLLVLLLITILSAAGCAPVSPGGSPSQTNAGKHGAADPTQSNDQGLPPENERLQLARELLFAWQPGWAELERQGKRAFQDGFATLVIDDLEQPGTAIYGFHIYEVIEHPDEAHVSTYGWYEVNLETGEIYDSILGEKVY